MKVTIKDVAHRAGVSPSTVSRALQGSSRISMEVRRRVEQIAREMEYRPNPLARGLVKQKSRIIGVVFPQSAATSMGHPFYPAVLSGAGQVAEERGYHMLLGTGSANQSDVYIAQDLENSGYVSGLLFLGAQADQGNAGQPVWQLPVVQIGRPNSGASHCFVDTHNQQAGYDATAYLLARGHRNILFLGFDARFCVTVDRRAGYEQALQAHGITLRKEWVVPERFIENAVDSSLLSRIFTAKERPSAVVSMDDSLSIALMSFLRSVKLRVSVDVSLISFNNTLAGEYCTPPLTTVDVAPFQLGSSAMGLLLDIMEKKKDRPSHIYVPFHLVERASVTPLQEQ